jgi:hypothetical protein
VSRIFFPKTRSSYEGRRSKRRRITEEERTKSMMEGEERNEGETRKKRSRVKIYVILMSSSYLLLDRKSSLLKEIPYSPLLWAGR